MVMRGPLDHLAWNDPFRSSKVLEVRESTVTRIIHEPYTNHTQAHHTEGNHYLPIHKLITFITHIVTFPFPHIFHKPSIVIKLLKPPSLTLSSLLASSSENPLLHINPYTSIIFKLKKIPSFNSSIYIHQS